MPLGSTQLSCPRCQTLCQTKGVTAFGVIIIAIASIITFGLGLIVGLIYLWHVARRPTVCPSCGYSW